MRSISVAGQVIPCVPCVTVVPFCITNQFIGVSLSGICYAKSCSQILHFTSFTGTQKFKCNFTSLMTVTYRPFFNQQASFII